MSTNPRDTQFAGFAKLLWQEIVVHFASLEQKQHITDGCAVCSRTYEELGAIIEPLIAERAYDLVEHVIQSQLQGIELLMRLDREWMAEQMQSIPDVTQWPEDYL